MKLKFYAAVVLLLACPSLPAQPSSSAEPRSCSMLIPPNTGARYKDWDYVNFKIIGDGIAEVHAHNYSVAERGGNEAGFSLCVDGQLSFNLLRPGEKVDIQTDVQGTGKHKALLVCQNRSAIQVECKVSVEKRNDIEIYP